MTVTQPDQERDGEGQWMEFWYKRRAGELAAMLTPEVIAEFEADPHGVRGRSKALGQILNFLRQQPVEQRAFAYSEVPFQRYRVARLRDGRGNPPEVDETTSYPSEDQAINAVFRRRLVDAGIAAASEAKK